jgi:hypothetical protein
MRFDVFAAPIAFGVHTAAEAVAGDLREST